MSRRKDRERYLRRKEQNPDYAGFRGNGAAAVVAAPSPTVSAVCSVCQRRRNVPEDTLPEDRDTFVCLQCQEKKSEEVAEASAE